VRGHSREDLALVQFDGLAAGGSLHSDVGLRRQPHVAIPAQRQLRAVLTYDEAVAALARDGLVRLDDGLVRLP